MLAKAAKTLTPDVWAEVSPRLTALPNAPYLNDTAPSVNAASKQIVLRCLHNTCPTPRRCVSSSLQHPRQHATWRPAPCCRLCCQSTNRLTFGRLRSICFGRCEREFAISAVAGCRVISAMETSAICLPIACFAPSTRAGKSAVQWKRRALAECTGDQTS